MVFLFRFIIAGILSVFYAAYLFEIYRHITNPINHFLHVSQKKKIHRLIVFFVIIIFILALAGIMRQFILPKPIFDLIVASVESVFIIPFFGTFFADHLLHAWRKKRLPIAISTFNIIATAFVAIATNMLILFSSEETIHKATIFLDFAKDTFTICLIVVLGSIGVAYWYSRKK